MGGSCFIKAWSKTMEILALSSGESELGAMVKGCTEGLGVKSLLADFDISVQVKILSDSTAAIGMVKRLGLGRVRHLTVSDLWIQQGIRNGSFTVVKHPSATNPADLMTKTKGRDDLMKLLSIMGFAILGGRSQVAHQRAKDWNVSQVVGTTKALDSNLNVGEDFNHHALYGVDSESKFHCYRSGLVHHYPSINTILEGRKLVLMEG